jgi:hypothetical protein
MRIIKRLRSIRKWSGTNIDPYKSTNEEKLIQYIIIKRIIEILKK